MSQKEKCVICGKETDVDYETPIDKREGYFSGVGQLCKKCYFDICVPNGNSNVFSIIQNNHKEDDI